MSDGDVIALTVATDEGLESPMDPRFGRAFGFLVVSQRASEQPRFFANPEREAARGAGPAAASRVRRLGAAAVISGRFGPKAWDALERLGIDRWLAPSGLTAGEALERFRRGELARAAG